MTTVKNLNLWDRGDEVKKMQNALQSAGYSVGRSGVDGIYGPDTQKALEAYQKANGLTSKKADTDTLNKLYGINTQPVETPEAPEEPKYTAPEKPTYTSKHDDEIDALYQQIMSRPAFSYDPMQDPLYGIMRDQAVLGGQMAMMDTQAQAANLTGGYGSSYGQQVGQQTYQGYLQNLNDAIPQLQEASRAAYDADTERMMLQYQMAMDNEDRDYSRFNDELSRYWADMEWNNQQDQWAYQVQQNERENLINMMAMGYTPTDEDLTRAGMTRDQANTVANAYTASAKGSGGGGIGGGYKTWGAEQTEKLAGYWDSGIYADAQALYKDALGTFSGYDPADLAAAIETLTGENIVEGGTPKGFSEVAGEVMSFLKAGMSKAEARQMVSQARSAGYLTEQQRKVLLSEIEQY